MINPQKILFFAPYQGLGLYSFLLAALANKLKKNFDLNSDCISCQGILDHFCLLNMESGCYENSVEEKRHKCPWCKSYSNMMIENNCYENMYFLDHFLTPENKKQIEEILYSKQDSTFFEVDEIPIGQVASYDLIRKKKIYSAEQIKNYPNLFKDNLRSVLCTYYSYKNFIKKHQYTSVVLIESPSGLNNIVRIVNKKNKIRTIELNSIACGKDRHFEIWNIATCDLQSYRNNTINLFNRLKPNIPWNNKNYIFTLDYLKKIFGKQYFLRFSKEKKGNTKKIHEKWNIKKEQKVILLATSCMDEAFALDYAVYYRNDSDHNMGIFKNQLEWIKKTVDFFRNKPEYKLIIRIHPREFKPVVSENAKLYLAHLQNLPESIIVDKDHEFSMYDIYDITDLCLTRQSTANVEAPLLGIPTLSWLTKPICYPIFNHFFSEKEYFFHIAEVLAQTKTRNIKYIEEVFLWHLFSFSLIPIEFSANNYWFKFPKKDLESLKKKQWCQQNNLPIMRIEDYFKNFFMEKAILNELYELLIMGTPIYETRLKHSKTFEHYGLNAENKNRMLKDLANIFIATTGKTNNSDRTTNNKTFNFFTGINF